MNLINFGFLNCGVLLLIFRILMLIDVVVERFLLFIILIIKEWVEGRLVLILLFLVNDKVYVEDEILKYRLLFLLNIL